MSHREEKDKETRRSDGGEAPRREHGTAKGALRKPGPRPAPSPLGQDEFPGRPRKSSKKDSGFEPDPDVEAGHE